MLDYFYGGQADLFSFYRLPKVLFTDPQFRSISAEAKILYGLLLDRMSLSARNDWLDEAGRVYIIFTVEEVMDALYCADNKASKLLRELEGVGLIERKRRGLGKPSLIYVKNFVSDPSESRLWRSQNHDVIRLIRIILTRTRLILSFLTKQTAAWPPEWNAKGKTTALCIRIIFQSSSTSIL